MLSQSALLLTAVAQASALCLCMVLAIFLTQPTHAQDVNPCLQIEQLDSSDFDNLGSLGQQCVTILPTMSPMDQDRHLRFYLRENPDYLGPDEVDPLARKLSTNARRMLLSLASMRKAVVSELSMEDANMLIRASSDANDLVALSHLHYAIAIQTARAGGSNSDMERHLRASLRLAEKSNLVKKYPHIYNALAVRARLDSEYDLAIDMYHQALNGFEDIGQFEHTGSALSNIGNIFNIIGGSKEAIRFHQRANESFKQYGNDEPYILATSYSNLGWAYREDGQLDQSNEAYLRAKEYAGQAESRFFLGQVGLGHAETLYQMGDVNAAIAMTEEAAPIVFELGDPVQGANGLLFLAKYYLEMDEVAKAQEALNSARTVLEPNNGGIAEVESRPGDAELKSSYARLSAELLTRFGRPSEAAPYFQAASKFDDIRFEDEKMKAVANSEVLFEIRERDSRLEKLEADAALAESELRQSRLAIGLALAVALLIATLAYASFRSYRLQKALVKTRDIFLQEIHHRTGNNFQMMASLLRSEERSRAKVTQSENGPNNTANRIRAMGLVHNHLYNMDGTASAEANLDSFVVELLDLLAEGLGSEDIELRHDISSGAIDVSIATPLALLLCELVTNAYKHAFPDGKGIIEVSLKDVDDQLTLIVADNGSGFDHAKAIDQAGSQGMHLIEDLTAQIGAKLTFRSANSGTMWTISDIDRRIKLTATKQQIEAV